MITSISSLSGAGNDSSVVLSQGDDSYEYRVDWTRDYDVSVQVDLKECRNDDGFRASYSVDIRRFLKMDVGSLAKRLHSDFDTWLAQANFSCDRQVDVPQFDGSKFDAAVADFVQTLRYYSIE